MHTPAGGMLQRLRASTEKTEEQLGQILLPMPGRMRLGALVRQTARQTAAHHVPAFAGNLTYNAFLAIFPFLLFLVSLLKVIDATGLLTDLIRAIARSLPSAASQVLRRQILPEVLSRLTTNPILSVLLALGSLWAVSAVARAGMEAMNTMYDVEESRPFWARFLRSLVLSLAVAVLFLAALGLLVLGPRIARWVDSTLGSGSTLSWLWNVGQWPLLVALAALAFALIYDQAPDTGWRTRVVLPGTVVGTVAWLAFSAGFALVLNRFGQNLVNPLYGWFSGLIILLMYMYWSSFILLVGAEINQVIGSHRTASGEPSGSQP